MEAIDYESVISPGNIRQSPVSLTTTEVNLTGSWKIFKPVLENGVAPCSIECPLKINIPKYIYELSKKNAIEALEILRAYNPIPAILGRVCPHFCMQNCNRSIIDEPLHTGEIEQYLGDIGLSLPYKTAAFVGGKHVAVIGSGPAGIGAAYYLSKNGIKVTIFEKEDHPGGLLRYGIPPYRLPREILDRELNNLFESMNVNLITNYEVKVAELPHLSKEFNLIFFAPGLGASIIPSDMALNDRILMGLELLNKINKGFIPPGNDYGVIGGGNVAVDVARSLLRLGKRVKIIYRRTIAEMPAYEEEKKQMLEEGITVVEKTLVGAVQKENNKLSVALHKAVKDNDKIVRGEPYKNIQLDYLVLAMGQTKNVTIPVGENIEIGGDYLIGASSVAESLASGKKNAFKIIKILNKEKIDAPPEGEFLGKIITPEKSHLDYIKKQKPIRFDEVDINKRITSFIPIHSAVKKEDVELETDRCITCGICNGCGLCWFFCPDNAITLKPDGDNFKVKILLEHCKGCGICSQVCPRGIINMEEDK
jgi:NADPH-dependent glutamate synthase beta subunit-like oxidoreductase